MGLFQLRESQDSQPLYRVELPVGIPTAPGSEKTLLIVGLGNIGKKYDGTRHNIGFAILDYFASKQDFPDWINKKDFKCHQTHKTIQSNRVILCKPTTMMNLSGQAVQAMQRFYKPTKTLVVYDELDIEFGSLRTRTGGSSAGHNGVASVSQVCGQDYDRLRVGIGPKLHPKMDSADFVLSTFTKEQQTDMKLLLQESNALLSEYIFSGGELQPETRQFLL